MKELKSNDNSSYLKIDSNENTNKQAYVNKVFNKMKTKLIRTKEWIQKMILANSASESSDHDSNSTIKKSILKLRIK